MNRRLISFFAITLAAALPASALAYGDYGHGGDRYGGYRDGPRLVSCESHDHRVRRCRVDTRGGVRIVERNSRAACIQGRSWGYDRKGIWVSNGCRAKFQVAGAYVAPGRSRGGDLVVCESIRGRPNFCGVRGGVRQVELVRQLSDTRCRRNGNWGYDRRGIWVERGCRAEFVVY